MNMIFDLTNSFKDAYNVEIKKTQIQKVLESRLVDNSIEISNISFNQRDFELTNYLIKKLVSKDYL
jgi:hypothetical protein